MAEVQVPDYTPSAKQSLFHASQAYETFFGGGAGPGKTAAMCAEAVTAALERPDTHVYIFRRTTPELNQSILPEIQKQCAAYLKYMPYNKQERRFTFSNGSFIQLAYLENPGDKYKYQSAEIHELLIDELTHFSMDEYEYLKTRVRGVGRSFEDGSLRIMAASNPGNIGHGWVKAYFIDVSPPGTLYKENGFSRIFFPALIDDHPIASFRKQYRASLNAAISDPQLKKALLEGDWSIFSGQVFTEWRRSKHVIESLPYKPDTFKTFKKFVGFDWGFRDPASAHWIAETPEDEFGVKHYIVYREMYFNERTPEWWANELKTMFDYEPVEFIVLPHDTYARKDGGKPIAERFMAAGLPVRPFRNTTHAAKINRQALLHEALQVSPNGKPYMLVHESCQNLIRTLPMLPYDDVKVEEIDDKSEDHAYDSLTYGLYMITQGQSMIVNPDLPKRKQEAYIVNEKGETEGFGIDFSKLWKRVNIPDKDWRYR